jgi:hypothetical protein
MWRSNHCTFKSTYQLHVQSCSLKSLTFGTNRSMSTTSGLGLSMTMTEVDCIYTVYFRSIQNCQTPNAFLVKLLPISSFLFFSNSVLQGWSPEDRLSDKSRILSIIPTATLSRNARTGNANGFSARIECEGGEGVRQAAWRYMYSRY